MATIKDLNTKITSLKQTRKITGAMKLIATTRFNKMQGVLRKSKEYLAALNDLYGHVAWHEAEMLGGSAAYTKSPSKASPSAGGASVDNGENTAEPSSIREVILFTSDRGLCGSFNNAIIKKFAIFLSEHSGEPIHASFVGRRGYEYFKKSPLLRKVTFLEGWTSAPSFEKVSIVADELITGFKSGSLPEVTLIYNHFASTISQKPVVRRFLPFEIDIEASVGRDTGKNDLSASEGASSGEEKSEDFIFEPGLEALAETCLQEMVRFNLYEVLLQSIVGEHAARMTAMDNATRNCDDLIDASTLERNRVRQAAITTELTEIISGAEAAK